MANSVSQFYVQRFPIRTLSPKFRCMWRNIVLSANSFIDNWQFYAEITIKFMAWVHLSLSLSHAMLPHPVRFSMMSRVLMTSSGSQIRGFVIYILITWQISVMYMELSIRIIKHSWKPINSRSSIGTFDTWISTQIPLNCEYWYQEV